MNGPIAHQELLKYLHFETVDMRSSWFDALLTTLTPNESEFINYEEGPNEIELNNNIDNGHPINKLLLNDHIKSDSTINIV